MQVLNITWRGQNTNKLRTEAGKKRGRAGLDRYVTTCVHVFPYGRYFSHLATIYPYCDNVNSKDTTSAKSSIHVTAYS